MYKNQNKQTKKIHYNNKKISLCVLYIKKKNKQIVMKLLNKKNALLLNN